MTLGTSLGVALRQTDGRLIYAVDDAYIHMAMAKTLATAGVWGCTRFHFSSSSSSLLWTFVLAVVDRVFQPHDSTPLVLNVALAIGTLALANASLARVGAPRLLRASASMGIVIAFPLSAMVLLGLEHILHLLLTIGFATVAVDALTRSSASPQSDRRRTTTLCFLGALLGASRYEGFFLIGLICAAFLMRRDPRRAIAIAVAALAPPVAIFGAVSAANGSYVLPNPLMVKAGGESASVASALLTPFGGEDVAFLRNNRAMPILLVLGLVSMLTNWRLQRGLWQPAALFPLLLAAIILLHGHFVFSPLYWVYRYDAYLVAFGVFVAAVVLAEMPGPKTLPRGVLQAALVVSLVPIIADIREGFSAEAETEGARNTYLEHFQTAEFVRLYYPGDTVIVNDVGAVTYYTQARILDLVGLGDVEPLAIMRRGPYTSRDVTAWTARYQPSIAVVQLGWSLVGPLISPDWIKVAVVELPPHGHRVGFFAVDPKEAWTLRARVAQHFGSFRGPTRYHVTLRPPESMTAAIGRHT